MNKQIGSGGNVNQQVEPCTVVAHVIAYSVARSHEQERKEEFQLYDHLVGLASTLGLEDGDFVIYLYAQAQGSNQGQS